MSQAAARPLQHLADLGRDFPPVWQQVDIFRKGRGVDLPRWPGWCFLPMAAWCAIATGGAPIQNAQALLQSAPLLGTMPRLAAIGAWAYTKGVYQFDPDVSAALDRAALLPELPAEALLRLPEWSVYIATPGADFLGTPLHGFWAHLEWDANDHRQELRFLLDTADGFQAHALHLGPWSMLEAMQRVSAEALQQFRKLGIKGPAPEVSDAANALLATALHPLLSRVLYLCSAEPEIMDRAEPQAVPAQPRPTRSRGQWRLFHAKRARIWSVGQNLGQAVRDAQAAAAQAQSAATRRTVAPHIRRAHWHGWWTGPVGGERRFVQKFLPPVLVRGAVDADLQRP